MLDINLDENKASIEKITLNSKNFQLQNTLTTIKCYQSFPDITTLEVKGINLIKIHKTIYLNLSNLVHIDLRENKLIKLSKNFKLFKNIKVLKLDNNQITYIPSFVSEFTKLDTLLISNNKLTAIPASIQYLTSLKVFKFSNNQIRKLPIEFDQLKSLECLWLDGNYFTEIPTTLCYLRHLNEISFEWLEFLDPPFFKILKEAMGKTCILIIRNSLQEMIKNSILYCDFATFVEKISSNKKKEKGVLQINCSNDQLDTKPNKIFLAIDNNYYGVVKALLELNEEYFKVKNNENKTSFYLSINNKNDDMIALFLSKIDVSKLPMAHVYFHKAIRTRNPELVKRLIRLGVNINSIDDQGAGCFHILFSAFTKQLSKCAMIGDFFLANGALLNCYNNENWAPIHIASRRGSKECLLWILSSNRKLRAAGKEEFDLNLKGKNKWTPLHLTINSFRIEETLILLENHCDVFARNIDAKTPKRVSNGNYLFTKLLSNYEDKVLHARYPIKTDNPNLYIRCFTTVDDEEFNQEEDERDDLQRCMTVNANNRKGIPGALFEPVGGIEATTSKFQKANDTELKENNKIKDKEKTQEKNANQNAYMKTTTNSSFFLNLRKINNIKTYKSEKSNKPMISPHAETSNNIRLQNNLFNTNNSNTNNNTKFNDHNSSNNNININNEINNNDNSEISNLTKESPFSELDNINSNKETILNPDSSLYEKYEAFRYIKSSRQNISHLIKVIIDNLDLENEMNVIMLSDICNYGLVNSMTDLLPLFTQLKNSLLHKKQMSFIQIEIINTIKILGILKEKSQDTLQYFNKPVMPDKAIEMPLGNSFHNFYSKQLNDDEYFNEKNEMFFHNNDEFNYDEMNEMLDNVDPKSKTNIIVNMKNDALKEEEEEDNDDLINKGMRNYHSMNIDHRLLYINKDSLPNESMNKEDKKI